MQLELLSKHHLKQLFNFELENRSWFESLIEPRDNDFYSEQGVYEHIDVELNKVVYWHDDKIGGFDHLNLQARNVYND